MLLLFKTFQLFTSYSKIRNKKNINAQLNIYGININEEEEITRTRE